MSFNSIKNPRNENQDNQLHNLTCGLNELSWSFPSSDTEIRENCICRVTVITQKIINQRNIKLNHSSQITLKSSFALTFLQILWKVIYFQ